MENEGPGKRQTRSNVFCFLFSIFHLSFSICHFAGMADFAEIRDSSQGPGWDTR